MTDFAAGDRVRGAFDLATVVGVLDGGRIAIEWDEIDSAGHRRADDDRATIRLAWTLTKVPQDTPMATERLET